MSGPELARFIAGTRYLRGVLDGPVGSRPPRPDRDLDPVGGRQMDGGRPLGRPSGPGNTSGTEDDRRIAGAVPQLPRAEADVDRLLGAEGPVSHPSTLREPCDDP